MESSNETATDSLPSNASQSVMQRLMVGIGNYLVLTECKHGPFLLNMRDTFIGKSMVTYGEWSESNLEIAHSLIGDGDMIIDVGAAFGAYTIPLAKAVGPLGTVVAFEAQRVLSQQLSANAFLNQLTNIEIHNAAVGNHTEVLAEVPKINYHMDGDFGSVSLLQDWKSIGAVVELVGLTSLDDLFFIKGAKCPSFINVDVEGMLVTIIFPFLFH